MEQGRGPGSSVGIVTIGWTVWDRIPVRTRFSAHPDQPWIPPSLLYNGYRVFPGGKVQPGCAADHSPPSSAAVMEESSTHPLGHTGPVMGELYLYLFNGTGTGFSSSCLVMSGHLSSHQASTIICHKGLTETTLTLIWC